MSTLGTSNGVIQASTLGSQPSHAVPDEWSEYPATSNVDLANFNINNGGTITASQFVGSVDVSGILNNISGTSLSYTTGTFIDDLIVGNNTDTAEQEVLKLRNAQPFRAPTNTPVSLGFYNALTNTPSGILNTVKFLVEDVNGNDNRADAKIRFQVMTDVCGGTGTGQLFDGYTIQGDLGVLKHSTNGDARYNDTVTISDTLTCESDISVNGPIRMNTTNINVAKLNLENGGTGSKLVLGTGNFLFNTTSPFAQEITATGNVDITFGGNSSSRYYERTSSGTTDLNLKFYNPVPTEASNSTLPLEHEILIYNNSVVGNLDLNFSILDSAGSPSAGFDFIYMTPTTKGKASSFTFTIAPSGTTADKLYHVKVKSMSDGTKDVKYFVQIS